MTGQTSAGRATALDHVGIVGADLDTLATVFEQLGFCLTPLARHAGGRTGNRCVMLRNGGYLELMATVDGGVSATLARLLARYAGIHILAFAIEDDEAACHRLHCADISLTAEHSERGTDASDPAAPRVAFALVTPPDPPEGRIHLIRHLTRATMWQDRFLTHANNVVGLQEVVMVVAEPAETAARLSVLAGRPVVPDPVGGYALDLGSGRVRIVRPDAWTALTGEAPPHIVPWIGGITLVSSDNNAAVRCTLADRGIAHREALGVVLVQAGGVTLRFQSLNC